MSDNDDRLAIQSTLDGTTKDFEKLIVKYQKPLLNLAFRITGTRDDAEDIVQAVFVKAYENLADFDPRYKFFSWIYRMTVNEAINFLNSRRRNSDLDPELPAQGSTPAELYEQQELSRQIDDALGNISLDYRVVVVLRHFIDLSYAEISEILDLPEKTIKSRLYTARQLLCRYLKENGVLVNG